jgi:hypothetical protein
MISLQKENETDKFVETSSSISSHKPETNELVTDVSIPDVGFDSTMIDFHNENDALNPNNGTDGNSHLLHHQSTIVTASYIKNSAINNDCNNDNESFFQLFKNMAD